jgi:hypothetical protein
MHHQLTLTAAQEHIADLHRAADHNRLLHTATSSHAVPAPRHAVPAPRHAVPAPRHAAAGPVSFLHWLRRRLA